jgi:parallel beta-helix repeat protein
MAALLLAAPAAADTLKVPQDFETIQAAVDAAVAGDVINVAKGVYTENVVVNTGGITLSGKNAVINGDYAGNCITVNAGTVTVQGFTLANGGSSGEVISGGPPPSVGGLLYTGVSAVISKNTVEACGGFGIRLDGTGSITSNTVTGCTQNGIEAVGALLVEGATITISKNTVSLCSNGIVGVQGTFTIEKNNCSNNGGSGVQLNVAQLPEGVAPLPSFVSGNNCSDNGEVGVEVTDPINTGSTIEKNTCDRNDLGILCDGVGLTVQSNKCTENRGGGMAMLVQSSTVTKNKLTGNGAVGLFVNGPTPVIALGPGDGVPNGDNAITENTIKTSGGDGILIVLSTGSTVEGNSVTDNLGDGITIDAAGGGNSGIQVLDNKVQNNGHDGIDNSGQTTLVSDNTMKGNGGNDFAGAGDGTGTTDAASANNVFDTGGSDQPGLLNLVTI